MMSDALFGKTFDVLERSLDVRQIRHSMIATNLANSETPGYRAIDVDFTQTMRNIIQRIEASERIPELNETNPTGKQDIFRIKPDDLEVITDDKALVGRDSNTVSMEQEMAKLQENRMMYGMITQMIAMRFRGLQEAITNRGQG